MNMLAVSESRIVGGCRLLRIIGRGSRSTVWVGFDADDQQVAVKVLEETAGDLDAIASVGVVALGRELEALHRAAGDHVVRLIDLDSGSAATALIFERLTGGDLAQLLAHRARIEAGEAVTVLAPLAATVQRMHAAGVAHGSLHPGRVLFRADGAPVLIGFGRAGLFAAAAPEALLETDAAVASDRAALVALASTVLGRVSGPREKVAAQLVGRFTAALPAQVAEMMATAIFELATPAPVRFIADGDDRVDGGGGTRLVPLAAPVSNDGRPESRAAAGASGVQGAPDPSLPVPRLFRADGPLAAALERGPAAEVRAAVTRRWSRWSPPRRRLVLAVAAGAAALVIAIAVVPGPASGPNAQTPDSSGGADPAEPTPASTVQAAAAESDAITADDPIAAAAELLDRRDRCFSELSLLCLDGVDQQNSAALDDDYAAIDAAKGGSELPVPLTVDPSVVIIVERLGNSALLDLGPESDPASLLLMKGEAGWRIRDYIAAGGE